MDSAKPIEWQKIKSGWLGFQGEQLLCIVEKMEDLPVEGYIPNILEDVFTTPEAAMKHGERILHQIENHRRQHDAPPPPPLATMALPLVKSIMQILEASTTKPLLVEREQADAQPKAD